MMGLLYDITKDHLYQEGLTKGVTKGREEAKRELIISLLEDNAFSMEKIAKLAKVSVEYVEAIAQGLRK
jgi:predicted HTH domain antitoxin